MGPRREKELRQGDPRWGKNAFAFSLEYRNRLLSDRWSGYNRRAGLTGAAETPRGRDIHDEMVSEIRAIEGHATSSKA